MNNYLEGVPRVSEIVSCIYPFEGEDKERYEDWLLDNVPEKRKRGFIISPEDYINEANNSGTYVHNSVENYILTGKIIINQHEKEIEGGIDIVNQLIKDGRELFPEHYILEQNLSYQGTIDLLMKKGNLVKLIDWKTWGIAKKKWNLKNEYKKNKKKLEKVELQLNLYAKIFSDLGYKIDGLEVVVLHEQGPFIHNLEVYNGSILSEKIDKYKLSLSHPECGDLSLYYNPITMQIRINTNIRGQAYTNAEITLEGEDFNKLSPEERINKAIELQKLLVSKY